MPRNAFILVNGIVTEYKLSGLKKRYFYPIENWINISLHWYLLYCSNTDINPKINQEFYFYCIQFNDVLWLFNTVKLVNRSCVIVERNHLFNLWAVENDLSTDALIAGFTNISLHTEITLNFAYQFSFWGRQLSYFNHDGHKPAVA